MSQLPAVIEAPALPATVQAEVDAARAFALNEKAAATRRAYRSDFAICTADAAHRGLDCLGRGRRLMPCQPVRITDRCSSAADRAIGAAPEQKAPATADRIAAMAALAPDTLAGKRDRALLLLGFARAFRRSELVALQVEDLLEAEGGYRVLIRRSKTDQEGQGQEIAIPAGGKLRAVEAVKAWLAAAGIAEGPVFRPVAKGGRLMMEALTDRSVANIVKAYAERTGLDPAAYAGHSLRAGFLTSASEHGANVLKMMEVSRHKSVDTLRGYVRRADLFRDHAGTGFL